MRVSAVGGPGNLAPQLAGKLKLLALALLTRTAR